MEMLPIPRSSQRKSLSLLVRGRIRSRPVFVDLIDLSEGGCKIKARPGFAEIDDKVVIKIGGINAPLGTVVWIKGGTAGVAFDGEMHPSVIEHLCIQHGSSVPPSYRS